MVEFKKDSPRGQTIQERMRNVLDFFHQRPGDKIFLGKTRDGKLVGVKTVSDHIHWGFVFDPSISPDRATQSFVETELTIDVWGRNNAQAFFPTSTNKKFFDEYASLPYQDFIDKATRDGIPPDDLEQIKFFRMTGGYEIPSDEAQLPLVGGHELLPLDPLG